MLYLYYGSKEDLFGACLNREMSRFIDALRSSINFDQSPKDLLRNTIVSFLRYIDANRASWIVMYTQATSSQAFAHTVREGANRSSNWWSSWCGPAPAARLRTPKSR